MALSIPSLRFDMRGLIALTFGIGAVFGVAHYDPYLSAFLALLLTVASCIAVAVSRPQARRGRAFVLSIASGVGGLFLGVAAQWLITGPFHRWGLVPLATATGLALLGGLVGARESVSRLAARSLRIVTVLALGWLAWRYYYASSAERRVLRMADVSFGTAYVTPPNQYPDARTGESHLVWLRRVLGIACTDQLTVRQNPARIEARVDWRCIRGLRRLEWLEFQGSAVTDDDLHELTQLKGLEGLSLQKTDVSGRGLRHLGKLSKIEFLDLSGSPLEDEAMRCVFEFPELETLLLAETPISDATPRILSEFEQRRQQQGAAAGLRSLILRHTNITDASITDLTNLVALRLLDITGTKVTAEGVARLRKRLPATQIASSFDP